jgi:5S rRNA maturation endonuclease (ribonuclease M5)
MLINFQTYKSDIRKRLGYLTRDGKGHDEEREKVDIFGNKEQFELLHRLNTLNTNNVRSFNFLVSFKEDRETLQKKLAQHGKTIEDLYDEVIGLLTAGYSREELSIFGVGHYDTDNYHFHITVNSQNILTGTQLYFERSRRFIEYLQAIREYVSLKYGLDLGEKRLISTGRIGAEKIKQLLEQRGEYREKTRDEIKEEITNILATEIARGTINSREELISYLEGIGLQINRIGKDYISVKYGNEKIRLKGGIYSDEHFKRIKAEIERDERGTGKDLSRELESVRERLEKIQQDIVRKIETRFRTARERANQQLKENIFVSYRSDGRSRISDRDIGRDNKLLQDKTVNEPATDEAIGTRGVDTRQQLSFIQGQKDIDIRRKERKLDRKANSHMYRTSTVKQKLREAIMDFEEKRKEEIQAIKELDPETVLNDLGIPYTKRPSYYEARAIWRGDRNPSLSIFRDGNTWRWKDHATGEAGTWIDLVMKVKGLGYVDAVRYLRENFLYSSSQSRKPQYQEPIKTQKPEGTWILQEVRELPLSHDVKTFLYRTRKIKHFPNWLKAVEYDIMNSLTGEIITKTGFGIKDIAGNYHIRYARQDSKIKERVLRQNHEEGTTYSLIKKNGKKAVVVEGFIDGIRADELLQADIVILNGVENWKKALEALKRYDEIYLALDNDDAGRKAEQEIVRNLTGKEIVKLDFKAKDLDEAMRRGEGIIYQPIQQREQQKENKKWRGLER